MAYTTIDDPSAFFQCTLYVGDGSTDLAITNSGNSDLQPDMVWIKNRDQADWHHITDVARGVNKVVYPNEPDAEQTTNYVKALNSDGFTIGAAGHDANASSENYVAWQWKEQAGVFDIVSYTGNGSNRTIAHNLGVVPKMMIVKRRNADSTSWFVYHVANGNGNVMKLDNTEAVSAYAEYWNSTTPTSSVFSLGTAATANVNNGTFICYLFGNKQGVSHCGSYTGNGNANGTFIYTGFKPAFLLIKRKTAVDTWHLVDNKRDPHNMVEQNQSPDTASADNPNAVDFDFLSNGFKLRNNDNNGNNSGDVYIYMAFAEQPFVTSTGVPATAR